MCTRDDHPPYDEYEPESCFYCGGENGWHEDIDCPGRPPEPEDKDRPEPVPSWIIRLTYAGSIVLAIVGAMMFSPCMGLVILSVAFLVFALGWELEKV